MDQNALVRDASNLIRWLDETSVRPRAAMWVYNSETDSWKLWIVPAGNVSKSEFFLKLSEVISAHRNDLPGFDISEVEFKADNHPAIEGLKSMMRLEGIGSAHLSNNRVNGFFLPDGILMRMAI
jgi:hypothetical protein